MDIDVLTRETFTFQPQNLATASPNTWILSTLYHHLQEGAERLFWTRRLLDFSYRISQYHWNLSLFQRQWNDLSWVPERPFDDGILWRVFVASLDTPTTMPPPCSRYYSVTIPKGARASFGVVQSMPTCFNCLGVNSDEKFVAYTTFTHAHRSANLAYVASLPQPLHSSYTHTNQAM